ncbi:MAG: ferrous iron transporter B, partial [Clostridia bacterium]|nr:ferrous iron transporter B [Clostridia bacterium]
FYSEFSAKGGKLDLPALKNLFGGEVFVGEAERKSDVEKFKKVVGKVLASPPVKAPAASDYKGVISLGGRKKSDDLFLSPLFIYPAFIFTLLFSFWLAFGNYGLGSMIGGAISRLFDFFKVLVGKIPFGGGSGFLKDFFTEGIVGGVGAVAVFLPQIAILSACMEFTDRSGFTSRVAAATDGLLSAIGLNGKAVYALFCGFGCTAVAAAQAEGIDDPAVKRRAVLSLPFVSCAARTPVYAIIAKVCFPEYAPLVMTGIYLFSATLSLIHALLLYKTADKVPPAFLVTELAPMRLPSFSSLIRAALFSAKNFAARIGTVVVLSSATVFILYGVTADFRYVAGGSEESLLSYMGRAFSVLLRPAGIDDWRFSAALFSGLFAKESVASSLALLFPNGFYLAPASGFALTVFFALYTPCFSALASISRAIGRKYAVLSAVWQLFIALAAAYMTYFVCGFI